MADALVPVAIVAAAWLAYFILKRSVGSIAAGVLAFAAGGVGLGAFVIWTQRHPPPFTFEPRAGSVTFLFQDPSLAAEFRVLNGLPAA